MCHGIDRWLSAGGRVNGVAASYPHNRGTYICFGLMACSIDKCGATLAVNTSQLLRAAIDLQFSC
jgi:hypothetical protein